MKKLLLTSAITLVSFSVSAQTYQSQPVYVQQRQTAPNVYQKQTVVRYNVPTCENCQTTTTTTRTENRPVIAPVQGCAGRNCQEECTNCAPTPTAYPVAPVTHKKSCVYNNHEYAIGNPLFVLRKGQFSAETVGGYFVNPKGARKGKNPYTGLTEDSGRFQQWDVAERIMYGLTDWLSLKLQGGYWAGRYNTKQYKAYPGYAGSVPHHITYQGTVGLEAHALDFCNLDLIVGVEGTWGQARVKEGNCDDSQNYTTVTPYATLGTQITQYVTPYIQGGYSFLLHPKNYSNGNKKEDDKYVFQPGFYIQPNKYFAIHPYVVKEEHSKPEWNLGVDFYPFKNVVFGVEGSAVSATNHPMDLFGVSGHLKMVF